MRDLGEFLCAVASDDLVSLKDIAARTGRSYESARLLEDREHGLTALADLLTPRRPRKQPTDCPA